jgi:hypothetical protein
MNSIELFEHELTAIIGRETDLRPFVCEGSPLLCEAFIVGFNPATVLNAQFWQFWHPSFGFDKSCWFEAYKTVRQQRPPKPEKVRRNAVSNTRRTIEWVLEEARPVRCLETNIHATPSGRAAYLARDRRGTEVFDFLLASIRPRIIVVHGKKAAEHIRAKSLKACIIAVPHFSRGWSERKARDLGQKIRNEYNAQQEPERDGATLSVR